ncbi:hypothetical protein [Enterobacter sp. CC120223-11]|uniref:hypothetical protein n=1 Tax=Enterobacter sp. CC120223-11 TaxID=1378073 RepID=UPI000BC5D7E4|nr:hypothetical protein [Enterobacter sp. CC120223-11]SNY79799.1 hypothetical protein SAMN02744775_04258 [Enterobacter sp. CC120223-11]
MSEKPPGIARTVLTTCLAGAAGGGIACLSVLLGVWIYRMSETGSAADWVSVACNIATVGIAWAAFKVARSWLPQLTTQEGYKEAIRLVNEQYIELGPESYLAGHAEKAMQAFRAVNEEDHPDRISACTTALDELLIALEAGYALQREIKEARFRLSTYGLTVAGRYEPDLTRMSCAFDDALDSSQWLLKLLSDDLRLRYEAKMPPLRYNSLNWSAIKLALRKTETAEGMEKQYQALMEHLSTMADNHTALFSHHPPVGRLFILKK